MDYGMGGGNPAMGGHAGSHMHHLESVNALSGHQLPENHEDQLKYGFKIIQTSFESKINRLNQELSGLRSNCEEQRTYAAQLQRKNTELQAETERGQNEIHQLAEGNQNLFKEVQALRRQLQRLEGIKKRVLDSMQDDSGHGGGMDFSLEDEGRRDDYRMNMSTNMSSVGSVYGATPGGRHVPMEPAQPPMPSSAGMESPAAMAAPGFGASGHGGSRPASPPPASAAGASAPPVDGKEFFRKVRSRISYEAFNSFLDVIKRLNSKQLTSEAALQHAQAMFGEDKAELYQEFELLLMRHGV